MFFSRKQNFENITVNQLEEELKNKELVVLDVRTPEETKGPLGKIESSINIPVDILNRKIQDLEKYKTQKIAIICQSGARSAVAAGLLKDAGYNVVNVLGGMIQYKVNRMR